MQRPFKPIAFPDQFLVCYNERRTYSQDNHPFEDQSIFIQAKLNLEILTKATVRLGARAASKLDAIQQAGEMLEQSGYVAHYYVAGTLGHEELLSTYLGNGIAIPPGRTEDLETVYHADISALQVPQGVDWEAGEKVYLVIGLAARSNEHTDILVNLVEVLHEPETSERLAQTSDPLEIIERLTRVRKP
jgi:phosphocarrier protein FPr